jgi:hypothetical protein
VKSRQAGPAEVDFAAGRRRRRRLVLRVVADHGASFSAAHGVGEIGITGTAAVANAVFHATGRRVGNLPITLDKLLCILGASSV